MRRESLLMCKNPISYLISDGKNYHGFDFLDSLINKARHLLDICAANVILLQSKAAKEKSSTISASLRISFTLQ